MGVCKVLRTTKHPLTIRINLFIGHPRCIEGARKIVNLLCPLMQQLRSPRSKKLSNQQVSTLLETGELLRSERIASIFHNREINSVNHNGGENQMRLLNHVLYRTECTFMQRSRGLALPTEIKTKQASLNLRVGGRQIY